MGSIFDLMNEDPLNTDIKKEILYRRYLLGISDIEDYGCEVTDEERFAILGMKRRIMKKMAEVLDEEIKDCICQLKSQKDL